MRIYRLISSRGIAGDRQAAASELGAQLRDRVEFERTTIWKDMVGMERRKGKLACA